MEAGLARYRDDSPRLPPLSLGLSSVRFIVNKLEAEYTRVIPAVAFGNGRELVKYDPNIDEGYEDDDSSLDRSRGRVWNRFVVNLGVVLCRCIPSVTFGNFGVLAVVTGLIAPKMLSYLVVYPFCRLVFGTLYPAYASYKAVRTKNLKEYVKWMMYWIVFALFTCTETFTDMFLSWFPFYYEVKIVLVLWLLSPATKGSSILYRKFVHPALCRREQEIDEYIAKAKDQGYHTVLNLGTKGVNYATTVIMQTAIKGGGGLVQQLRKSYSLSDLSECEPRAERSADEADDVLTEPRLVKRPVKSGYNTRRSASESNSRAPMYFPEMDVDVRSPRARVDEPDFSHIKSTEDISSGYSSGDTSTSLSRAGSLGAAARARAKTSRTTITTIKRPLAAEDNEVIIEEQQEDDSFEYANMPPLVKAPSPLYLSHSEPPFLYRYVGDQVQIVQILGDYPLSTSSHDKTNNTDSRDQNEVASDEASLKKDIVNTDCVENKTDQKIINKVDDIADIPYKTESKDNNEETSDVLKDDYVLSNDNIEIKQDIENKDAIITDKGESITKYKEIVNMPTDEKQETTSLDTSINDNESADSDDEASYGTPDDSPKSKRKAAKGKYGKPKAPPPPPPITDNVKLLDDKITADDKTIESATSQESLADIVKSLPNTSFKESGLYTGIQVVNPIAEKKMRHKSKSPGRVPKGNSYGIGKLLQLPSKFAFWNKTEDKPVSDSVSTSSDDQSGRFIVDDFQSCLDLNTIASKSANDEANTHGPQVVVTDERNSYVTAGLETEITQDIKEKSDVLQKLIDAKIENHPEYKFVSLHGEIAATSKSTDV